METDLGDQKNLNPKPALGKTKKSHIYTIECHNILKLGHQ